MNPTDIEWADMTWNPCVGCLNDCYYCYARELHNRRHRAYKEGKKLPKQYKYPYNTMQFFPERLDNPYKKKKGKTVFIGSMCEFRYISKEWIMSAVFGVCQDNPQHTFMFLTKFPDLVYRHRQWSKNCMLGATITSRDDLTRLDVMSKLSVYHRTFISVEPLCGDFTGVDFSMIDLVIVGAMTKQPKGKLIVPEMKWIDSIKHHNIFYKDTIREYME